MLSGPLFRHARRLKHIQGIVQGIQMGERAVFARESYNASAGRPHVAIGGSKEGDPSGSTCCSQVGDSRVIAHKERAAAEECCGLDGRMHDSNPWIHSCIDGGSIYSGRGSMVGRSFQQKQGGLLCSCPLHGGEKKPRGRLFRRRSRPCMEGPLALSPRRRNAGKGQAGLHFQR